MFFSLLIISSMFSPTILAQGDTIKHVIGNDGVAYATVADAITGAGDATEVNITLAGDITEYLYIGDDGKNLTIDLAGHRWTGVATDDSSTVKTAIKKTGGYMVIKDTAPNGISGVIDGDIVNEFGTFQIDGGIFEGAIKNESGYSIQIYGGTFNGEIQNNDSGKINIEGGTFNAGITENGGGTIYIYDGTFNGNIINKEDNSYLYTSGGEFNNIEIRNDFYSANIILNGGIFKNVTFGTGGYRSFNDGIYANCVNAELDTNNGVTYKYTDTDPLSEYNDATGFNSNGLDYMLSLAKDSDTAKITVIMNNLEEYGSRTQVVDRKNLELALEADKIEFSKDEYGYYVGGFYVNDRYLECVEGVVTYSTEDCYEIYTNDGYMTEPYNISNEEGNKTFYLAKNIEDYYEDINIEQEKKFTIDLNGYNISFGSEAKIINNGTLSIIDSYGGGSVTTLTNDGTATISGGTVTNLTNNGGTTTISGGTVTTLTNDGTANINGGTVNTLTNNKTATISGGTITNLTNNSNGTATISSGTITTLENNGTVTISGGTITTIKNSEHSKLVAVSGGTVATISDYYNPDNYTYSFNYRGEIKISGGTVETIKNTSDITVSGGTITSLSTQTGKLTLTGNNYNIGVVDFRIIQDRPTKYYEFNSENIKDNQSFSIPNSNDLYKTYMPVLINGRLLKAGEQKAYSEMPVPVAYADVRNEFSYSLEFIFNLQEYVNNNNDAEYDICLLQDINTDLTIPAKTNNYENRIVTNRKNFNSTITNNGKILLVGDDSSVYNSVVNNEAGILTINNNVNVTSLTNYGNAKIKSKSKVTTIDNYGTLTNEAGNITTLNNHTDSTYTMDKYKLSYSGGYLLGTVTTLNNNGTATINGGTVNYFSNNENSTATITDGTITLNNSGTVDITGGKIRLISNTGTINKTGGEYVHYHPVCDTSCTHDGEQHHEHIEWNKLGENFTGGLLAGGNYYLDRNINLTEPITFNSEETVNLCLNGYVLTAPTTGDNCSVFILDTERGTSNATLNLSDCGNTVHKFTPDTNGLWVIDEENGTKTVNGGVITGGTGLLSEGNRFGGAIYIYGNNTVNLYDGNVVGNMATKMGGAVYMNGDTSNAPVMNVYGGGFYGNVSNVDGGAIGVSVGTLTTYNARFEANKAITSGGAIYTLNGYTSSNTTYIDNTGKGSGAVWTKGTSTVTNDTYQGNSATGDGAGAIYSDSGMLSIYSSNFTSNTATSNGGAIYARTGMVNINNSHFEGNESTGGDAGAVYVVNGDTTLVSNNTTYTENKAKMSGGAIFAMTDSSVTIEGGSFNKNKTTDPVNDGNGGAIAAWNGTNLTVKNASFTENEGLWGGAIRTNGANSILIENSTFTGNKVKNNATGNQNRTGYGGALRIVGTSNATITGCSFTENQAWRSGGAIFAESPITISDTTIKGNDAGLDGNSADGGEIRFSGEYAFSLNNVDIQNNTATTGGRGAGVFVEKGTLTLGGKVIIDNNTLANDKNNLYNDAATINIGSNGLATDSLIGYSTKTFTDGAKVVSSGATENDAKYFYADINGKDNSCYYVECKDGTLIFKKCKITIDGVQISYTGTEYTFPVSTEKGFIAYTNTNGTDYYDAGDTVAIDKNLEFSTIAIGEVKMLEGASIRLDQKGGIRFETQVDTTKLSALPSGATVEKGTLITLKELATSDLTLNSDYTTVNVKYLASEYRENGTFAGSLVKIKDTNIAREFVGRGYVTVTVGNITKTIYADYANGDIANNSRSIAYIANAYKTSCIDEYNSLSDSTKALVDGWAEKFQQTTNE